MQDAFVCYLPSFKRIVVYASRWWCYLHILAWMTWMWLPLLAGGVEFIWSTGKNNHREPASRWTSCFITRKLIYTACVFLRLSSALDVQWSENTTVNWSLNFFPLPWDNSFKGNWKKKTKCIGIKPHQKTKKKKNVCM